MIHKAMFIQGRKSLPLIVLFFDSVYARQPQPSFMFDSNPRIGTALHNQNHVSI